MKTLIDKIIIELNQRVGESFDHMGRRELDSVIDLIKEMEENASFKDVASLLMKYMGAKCHPHSTTIVTSVSAEVLYGKKTTGKTIKTRRTFETEYQLQEWKEIESQHFDSDGKAYLGQIMSRGTQEQMLKLINQLDAELTMIENNH